MALMSPPGELLMGLNTKDQKQLKIHRLGGFREKQVCFQLLISLSLTTQRNFSTIHLVSVS